MNNQLDWIKAGSRWRAAFYDIEENPNRGPHNQAFWEGESAYREAMRNGVLSYVKLTRKVTKRNIFRGAADRRIRDIGGRLAEAVSRYQEQLELVERGAAGKDLLSWLAKIRQEFLQTADRWSADHALAESLKSISNAINEVQNDSAKLWESRWQNLHRGTFNRLRPKPNLSRQVPKQRRELDTRLICEFGSLFRSWVSPHEISLRTIARLIMLALVCLCIAKEERNSAVMAATGGRISVASVYQKLRRAGIK
jgi:hypothetical protein